MLPPLARYHNASTLMLDDAVIFGVGSLREIGIALFLGVERTSEKFQFTYEGPFNVRSTQNSSLRSRTLKIRPSDSTRTSKKSFITIKRFTTQIRKLGNLSFSQLNLVIELMLLTSVITRIASIRNTSISIDIHTCNSSKMCYASLAHLNQVSHAYAWPL